jgi:Ice-binding-like
MILPWAATANAESILLSDLASFAVLGATTVTNTGSTILVSGNVGVHAGTAIIPGSTGFTFAGPAAGISIVGGVASLAQSQLDTALGLLDGLSTSGSILGGVLDGLTLARGVYGVSAAAGNGGFNLSTGQVLTLDAEGSSNPFWVFQMDSTLNTGSGSVVQFVNQGANFNQVCIGPSAAPRFLARAPRSRETSLRSRASPC